MLAALALVVTAQAPTETVEERLLRLEKDNAALREELDLLRDELEFAKGRVDSALTSAGRLTGYVDFGFFRVQGDGSGLRTDVGHERLPKYQEIPDSWVFLGDPLATAV